MNLTSTRSGAVMAGGLIALMLGGAALVGCTEDDGSLSDADVSEVDDKAQFVMTNLDKYPNVAFRCFNGPDVAEGGVPTGVYTTTRDVDSLKLVVNDPQCPGYDPSIPTVISR